MITYKTTIDRYCPNREENVKVEIARHDNGQVTEQCLCNSCRNIPCTTYPNQVNAPFFPHPHGGR